MISPELDKALEQPKKIWQMIWIALTFSILIHGLIPMIPGVLPSPATPNAMVQSGLGIAAITAAIVSLFMRAQMMSESRIKKVMESRGHTTLIPDELGERDGKLYRLVHSSFGLFIVRLACNESIAVLGVVASFLTGDLYTVYIYAAFAFFLNLMSIPNFEILIQKGQGVVPA